MEVHEVGVGAAETEVEGCLLVLSLPKRPWIASGICVLCHTVFKQQGSVFRVPMPQCTAHVWSRLC